MKSIKYYLIGLISISTLFGQELCPASNVEAYFYDEKIELSWLQTDSYGDVLFDECFLSCSLAVEAMEVVHDSTSCGD